MKSCLVFNSISTGPSKNIIIYIAINCYCYYSYNDQRLAGVWAASATNSRWRHGGHDLSSCGCGAYTTAADVDPDDGCGRTTWQGRTVTAPVAAASTAAAHSVAGSRSTWSAHISTHGAHVASSCPSSGESLSNIQTKSYYYV